MDTNCIQCGFPVDPSNAVVLLDGKIVEVFCRWCVEEPNAPETVDTVWGTMVVGGEG